MFANHLWKISRWIQITAEAIHFFYSQEKNKMWFIFSQGSLSWNFFQFFCGQKMKQAESFRFAFIAAINKKKLSTESSRLL